MKRCFYEVLSCSRTSDAGEIKSAFRKAAMECHPDRNPGDHTAELKFKEINEAYDVLKDDQRRAAYDRFGHAAFEQGGPGGMGGGARGAGPFDFAGSFGDVFEDLFGELMGGAKRGGGGRRVQRGADLRYNLVITLEDAFSGRKAEIKVPTAIACEPCNGSGAAEGSSAETCSSCNGHGKVRAAQGFFTIERTCSTCQGTGRVIKKPCKACRGAGQVQKEKTLTVDIPRGVEEGTRIRLSGEGMAGAHGGPPGDLYIFIGVSEHDIFSRDGNDLYCRVPVSFVTASLGGAIEVPTLDGDRAKVNVPEGVQSGHQIKVRGRGMPALRGSGLGDLYIAVAVETPVKLSRRQKELLREFESECAAGTHPEAETFLGKIKDFWNGGEKA